MLPYRPMARFNLQTGEKLGDKYVIDGFLGYGWEGEVYRILERATGIGRAAKLFYPERNINNQALRRYAQKSEKLAFCPLVIRYHTHDRCDIGGDKIDFFVSSLNEGESLTSFVKRQPGKRLSLFEALVFLRELASGLEMIHNVSEYHGDLHSDNILIRRKGTTFELKIIDFFDRGKITREHIHDDVCDAIRLFYDVLGGKKRYAQHPREAKFICAGLKRSIITKRFPRAGKLRQHLETFDWNS